MKYVARLIVFLATWVTLVGCLNAPAARPTLIPISSDPALGIESLSAASVCPPHTPTPVPGFDLRLPISNVPRAFVAITRDARLTLAAIGGDGNVALLNQPAAMGQIQLSADGNTLAYEVLNGPNPADNFVIVLNLLSGRALRLTPSTGCAILGFTLDATGRQVVYSQVAMRGQFRPAAWQITLADLSASARTQTWRGEGETALVPLAWSSATETIVFRAIVPFQTAGHRGVWLARADASNVRLLLRESEFVGTPIVTADGRWLAYLASDAERVPKTLNAIVGEPPANRIAAINLLTGERRTLAETAQSFGAWTMSNERVFFAEGIWEENWFRFDRIQMIGVHASPPQMLATLAASELVRSMQTCGEDSVVFSIHDALGESLRWWTRGQLKTLASEQNVAYQILGCIE